jgi:hypothetical protein
LRVFKSIQRFWRIGGSIPRIEGSDQAFVPVWIKDEVPLSRWALDVALEKAWEKKVSLKEILEGQALDVPISAIYRDYNDLWYRSSAMKFSFDPWYDNRIEFSAVQQERLPLGH